MVWGPSDAEDPGEPYPGSGWVPPEARSWRHPSELSAGAVTAAPGAARIRWRRRAAVVGTLGLIAVVAGTVLLVQTGSTRLRTEVDSVPIGTAAVTSCCRLPPAVARGVEESLVSIGLGGGHAPVGCGVVVGDGLVATTTAALDGRRRVQVLAATGRVLEGTVVASDHQSGIALLRLSAELPAAVVHGAASLRSGSAAVTVALRVVQGATHPQPSWSSATVVSVGELAPGGSAGGMAAITVRGPASPVMPGEALVDPQGHVEGILVASRGDERAFLPMRVVAGISNELETLGKVRHGWLGVTDSTATGHSGAVVRWVDPRGAAAGKLEPGDTIVRVDGDAVPSSVALRSMLYAMTPGTSVRVDAVRAGRSVHTVVRLAAAP